MISASALTITTALAQLAAADVTIDLTPLGAVVDARYHFASVPDTLTLLAPRIDAQQTRIDRLEATSGQVLPFGGEHGAATIRVVSAGPQTSVHVRYEVRQRPMHRIPLFVPGVPTLAGTDAVRLRVVGIAEPVRLMDAFPRLTRSPDGSTAATLANVPSLVRLPPATGSWSTNRVADLVVVILVVGSSAFWLLRRRRRAL